MSMVERVARAICKALRGTSADWLEWVPEARAAIAAMREPTEAEKAMLSGIAYDAIRMEEKWPELFHRAWTAMIDKALEEDEG